MFCPLEFGFCPLEIKVGVWKQESHLRQRSENLQMWRFE